MCLGLDWALDHVGRLSICWVGVGLVPLFCSLCLALASNQRLMDQRM